MNYFPQVMLQATTSLRQEPVADWLKQEVGGVSNDHLSTLCQLIVSEHEKLLLVLGYSDHQPITLVLDTVSIVAQLM